MKVVLFCGGQGMRLREHSESIPKPMVPVGDRPILWHLMRYYAHFGHTDFVLCLGWNGQYIRDYFNNLAQAGTHSPQGGSDQGRPDQVAELTVDGRTWRVNCVETGLDSLVGQRLKKVQDHVHGEQQFLANYADGLSDVDLNKILAHHDEHKAVATCLCVKPTQSFHLVDSSDGLAVDIRPVSLAPQWMNGGFFVFQQEIFDNIKAGEDLAMEPFRRLIDRRQLACYNYDGFWGCMDTFKEKQDLDDMFHRGDTPWAVWGTHAVEHAASVDSSATDSTATDTPAARQ